MVVVKERDPGFLQSEKCMELGPVRADRQSEVEGVVSP